MPSFTNRTTGLVFDTHFLAHDTGVESTVLTRSGSFEVSPDPHPSSLAILRRTKEFLDGSGLSAQMRPLPARPATQEELTTFHTPEYVAGIRACAAGGPREGSWGTIDSDTVLSPGSFEAALYAAGGAMNAVRAVIEGQVSNAYALLRPPCHHATRNSAQGFCIFNNTALAALYARQRCGLERVLIIDWDVHHGNGTQEAFYSDPNVLFISLHQQNWFPQDGGTLEQVGSGAGLGSTVNIPLPPGTGDRGYHAAFTQLVLPIARQFRPQLILVTAGQDANWMDPMAQMMVTMDGYRQWSSLLVDLAQELCAGRLVLLHAGGYSPTYVPYCTVAAIEPLLAMSVELIDPNVDSSEVAFCQSVFSSETRQALADARTWHQQWWRL